MTLDRNAVAALAELAARVDQAQLRYRAAQAEYDRLLLDLVRAQCRAEVSRVRTLGGRLLVRQCLLPKGHAGEHSPEPAKVADVLPFPRVGHYVPADHADYQGPA